MLVDSLIKWEMCVHGMACLELFHFLSVHSSEWNELPSIECMWQGDWTRFAYQFNHKADK